MTVRWPEGMPGHVLVGLSGGADSVALLLLLLERGGAIAAVHVNHGLRGEDSDGDEAFVRSLCADKGVPLWTCRASPPEGEKVGEDWARQVRYGFFREAMAASGAEALVLAHHLDDQAETLLMRLMRGTGLTGLTGMAADTDMDGMRVLRPLLTVSGRELRAMLRSRGQPWREDATNGDPRYLRNALRLDMLPLMEERAPGTARHIAETASLLREDEEALRWMTDGFLKEHDGGLCLPVRALDELPVGLTKRVLRSWWARQGTTPLDHAQTDALARLLSAHAGSRCNLPCDWHAMKGWTHLHLLPPGPSDEPTPVSAADGATMCGVTLTVGPADGTVGDGRASQLIPVDLLTGLTLRTWRPGDWIAPFGMAGRKSMQDYFTDRHVDAPFRRRVPLICRGDEVLLCCGVGVGDIPKMNVMDGVTLRWSGPMPWLNT